MRYDHERREEWLDWFMSPTTSDPKEITTALASIPRRFEPWMFVETRLRVALEEEKARLAGEAVDVREGEEIIATVPTHFDPDGRLWTLVELKEQLFYDEVANRRPGGVRDSLSLVHR